MSNVTISISTSQIFRSWVAIFQLRPPMASLSRSLYNMPGLVTRMDILFWGRRDFQISFLNKDTLKNALNRHWRSVISIRGSYQTIWGSLLMNIKWHSVTWPYPMTTHYWSDLIPNSTFNRILRGFHRTFAMGVTCRQGTLTPPDTWSLPFGTCICSTCWEQTFSRTCRYFFRTMLLEYPSVLSRFSFAFHRWVCNVLQITPFNITNCNVKIHLYTKRKKKRIFWI